MGQAFGCVKVDQSTIAIKEDFGKFNDALEPGCHCVPWCFGSQVAGHLSLRIQQLDVRCETKTKVCRSFISAVFWDFSQFYFLFSFIEALIQWYENLTWI